MNLFNIHEGHEKEKKKRSPKIVTEEGEVGALKDLEHEGSKNSVV